MEIDELAVRYSGVRLMETALNRNLVGTWDKLRRISPEEVDLLIEAYLAMEDFRNIKTILARPPYRNENRRTERNPASCRKTVRGAAERTGKVILSGRNAWKS